MYQLLDFGEGRRLERFGPLVLDRASPAAEKEGKGDPDAWRRADARFDQTWQCRGDLPERWAIAHGKVMFELKRTEFGHLGVFPEQAANWDWLEERLRAERAPIKVLNLFAYTGGSTLAAAAAGAEVVHVDAARNIVAWARRNGELSGLADAPIRWIAEDAMKFVRRELRRGNRYDAVILDPPSYGHGAHGEVWRLSKHLPKLLAMCDELTAGRRRFVLLTCHTPGFGPERLRDILAETLGDLGTVLAAELTIRAATGRRLPAGVVARWEEETGRRIVGRRIGLP
ncbi:MAG: class I SAM-dependent methyltransferase [Pirellulales bacterium]|nr:class I SAM-dependent methyltransferase [Pirellulales bacterium]